MKLISGCQSILKFTLFTYVIWVHTPVLLVSHSSITSRIIKNRLYHYINISYETNIYITIVCYKFATPITPPLIRILGSVPVYNNLIVIS